MSQSDKKEEVDTSLRVLVSDLEEVVTEVPVVNMTDKENAYKWVSV